MASSTLKFTTEVNRLGIQQDSGAVVYIPRELSVAIEDSGSLRLEVSGNLVQLLPFSGFDFTIDGGSVYVSLTTLVADLNDFFNPSSGSVNPYPGSDYAKDGTDGTGITPPTGAVGIRGWLSGIYSFVKGFTFDGSSNLNVKINSGNITGFATSANQTNASQKTQIVDGSGNVIGSTGNALDVNIKTPTTLPVSVASLPLPSGAATEAKQDAEAILIGAVNETAPGTDTASSGLNGRLQRIAQRITSLISALGSPFQAGGSIGNTSFGSTVADGANVVEGALADAIVAAGAAGSISAKLRRVTQGLEDLKTLIVLAAGTNIIGKVGIDQTTDGTTNKVRATSTINESYGSSTSMTVTNLNSLGNSATAGWQSARVDNFTSLKAIDFLINVKLTMANTAPGSDKAFYVYICPWYYDGSTWYANAGGTTTLPSGTEGTYTIANPHNLILLGTLNYTTQQMVLQSTFLLSSVFGNNMPDGFSIIGINFTGAAVTSSSNIVQYKPINQILV